MPVTPRENEEIQRKWNKLRVQRKLSGPVRKSEAALLIDGVIGELDKFRTRIRFAMNATTVAESNTKLSDHEVDLLVRVALEQWEVKTNGER